MTQELAIITKSSVGYSEDFGQVRWFITLALMNGSYVDHYLEFQQFLDALMEWQCDSDSIRGKAVLVDHREDRTAPYLRPFAP